MAAGGPIGSEEGRGEEWAYPLACLRGPEQRPEPGLPEPWSPGLGSKPGFLLALDVLSVNWR